MEVSFFIQFLTLSDDVDLFVLSMNGLTFCWMTLMALQIVADHYSDYTLKLESVKAAFMMSNSSVMWTTKKILPQKTVEHVYTTFVRYPLLHWKIVEQILSTLCLRIETITVRKIGPGTLRIRNTASHLAETRNILNPDVFLDSDPEATPTNKRMPRQEEGSSFFVSPQLN